MQELFEKKKKTILEKLKNELQEKQNIHYLLLLMPINNNYKMYLSENLKTFIYE